MLTNGAAARGLWSWISRTMNSLPGAALAVDENGRIERRDARGELQDVLHRLAAGDEVLRGGMTVDALAQEIQLTLAAFQQPLAPIQFLQPRADGIAQPLHLLAQIGRLEIGADGIELGAPALCVASDR